MTNGQSSLTGNCHNGTPAILKTWPRPQEPKYDIRRLCRPERMRRSGYLSRESEVFRLRLVKTESRIRFRFSVDMLCLMLLQVVSLRLLARSEAEALSVMRKVIRNRDASEREAKKRKRLDEVMKEDSLPLEMAVGSWCSA